jgi:hypothetical protein
MIALSLPVSHFYTRIGALAVSLLLPGPAHAAASNALPDPSGLTLFALGVAGVAVGRYLAGKRKD